jgi:hypothetical protein
MITSRKIIIWALSLQKGSARVVQTPIGEVYSFPECLIKADELVRPSPDEIAMGAFFDVEIRSRPAGHWMEAAREDIKFA